MDAETREQMQQDLADNLRMLVAGEILNADQARAVYISMFGVRAADLEFGPEVPRQQGRHERPEQEPAVA